MKRKSKPQGTQLFGGKKIYPDGNLAAIVGDKPQTPSEIMKKLWKYYRKHGLFRE